jgi:hypothetical protein
MSGSVTAGCWLCRMTPELMFDAHDRRSLFSGACGRDIFQRWFASLTLYDRSFGRRIYIGHEGYQLLHQRV